MALFECLECKKKISNSAIFCPHCGCVYQRVWLEKSEKFWQIAAVLNILITIAIVFFLLKNNPKSNLQELSVYMSMSGLVSIGFFIYGWATSKLELKSR